MDGLTVREDAPLPLRADTGDGATVVPNQGVFVNRPGTGDIPVNKDEVAVFSAGNPVTLEFEDRTGVDLDRYGGETVRLVAARMDPPRDPDVNPLFQTPLDLFTLHRLNRNFTFVEARDVALDGDGENDAILFTPDRAGEYVVFLATGGTVTLSGGDISVSGNATVIGIDTFPVQRNASSVDAPDEAEAGDTLEFTVDSGLPDGDTNHLVALYSEGQFVDSVTTIDVPKSFGGPGTKTVRVRPDIKWFTGVARLENDTSLFNRSFSAGRVEDDRVKVRDAFRFLESKAGVNTTGKRKVKLKVNPTGSDSLDASLTVDRVGPRTTLRVDTLKGWSDGTYRWVHVATQNTSLVATATGTLDIKAQKGNRGNRGGGGGSGGSSGGGSGVGGGAAVGGGEDVEKVYRRFTALALTPGRPGAVEFPEDSPVRRLGITVRGGSVFDPAFSVGRYGQRPDDVDQPRGRVWGYLSITSSVLDRNLDRVEIEFTVEREWLDAHGLSPGDVVLSRWHDGGWRDLDTRVLGDGDAVTLRATSPGLSVFAIHAEPAGPGSSISRNSGGPAETTPTDEPQGSGRGRAPGRDEGVPGAVIREEGDATTTPGFTALTALIGAAAALLVRRRR